MAAITAPLVTAQPNLRPLNIVRDLPAVADLVEKCFADTMDAEGREYIHQMRRAGRDNAFLRWASRTVETVSMPLSGYVWEENREIIGNASLIPYHHAGKKYYLIANVAVHPDFRRKGIGRALTVAGMQHATRRKADEIWLHVRSDNPGAITLYRDLGFVEQFRRTTWDAQPLQVPVEVTPTLSITRRSARDWPNQQEWLKRSYPQGLSWYQPISWINFRPGLGPAIIRFMSDVYINHWVGRRSGQSVAIVTCQSALGHSNRLWLAASDNDSQDVIPSLLMHAMAHSNREKFVLDLPAGQYLAALQTAGFKEHRTLLWMRLSETWMNEERTSN
jgi:ribosomal protein S18 acetylase RimI-like enzyme